MRIIRCFRDTKSAKAVGENGTNRLATHKVAINLQSVNFINLPFIKIYTFLNLKILFPVKHNKAKQ